MLTPLPSASPGPIIPFPSLGSGSCRTAPLETGSVHWIRCLQGSSVLRAGSAFPSSSGWMMFQPARGDHVCSRMLEFGSGSLSEWTGEAGAGGLLLFLIPTVGLAASGVRSCPASRLRLSIHGHTPCAQSHSDPHPMSGLCLRGRGAMGWGAAESLIPTWSPSPTHLAPEGSRGPRGRRTPGQRPVSAAGACRG